MWLRREGCGMGFQPSGPAAIDQCLFCGRRATPCCGRTPPLVTKRRTVDGAMIVGARPHDLRLVASLGLDQLAQELATLLGPSLTNFTGQDHQLPAPVLTSQFRMAEFHASSGGCHYDSAFVGPPRGCSNLRKTDTRVVSVATLAP